MPLGVVYIPKFRKIYSYIPHLPTDEGEIWRGGVDLLKPDPS